MMSHGLNVQATEQDKSLTRSYKPEKKKKALELNTQCKEHNKKSDSTIVAICNLEIRSKCLTSIWSIVSWYSFSRDLKRHSVSLITCSRQSSCWRERDFECGWRCKSMWDNVEMFSSSVCVCIIRARLVLCSSSSDFTDLCSCTLQTVRIPCSRWMKTNTYMHFLETNTLYTNTSQTMQSASVCVCVCACVCVCVCVVLSSNGPATVELWRSVDSNGRQLSWHQNFKSFTEIWTTNFNTHAAACRMTSDKVHRLILLSQRRPFWELHTLTESDMHCLCKPGSRDGRKKYSYILARKIK